jgi:hypothetical protein
LPSSTQWEIVESVADKIHPVYAALMRHAAGGDVVYNDDTVMKVLELMKQSEEDRHGRKGMYTSGILPTVIQFPKSRQYNAAIFIGTGNYNPHVLKKL